MRFFSPIPRTVYVVAALAAVFHLAILWHAQSSTPEGWEFTGNLSNSPDYMQYRVWERQTQQSGPIAPNKLTPEANPDHLPLFFYWGIGQIARVTGVAPAFVYEYTGAILAFLLVILLFLTVRHFMVRTRPTWWVFLIILLGGGLTSHLEAVVRRGGTGFATVNRLIEPVEAFLTLDNMRFAYVYKTLMDTHFLVVYLLTTLTLLSAYFALRVPSWRRFALTAGLTACTTLIHLYEGILLLAIVGAMALLLLLKRAVGLDRVVKLAVSCGGAAAATLGVLFLMQRSSGLPLTSWSAPDIFLSNVLLGYPVGWAVLGWGFVRFWENADLDRLFLLGWIVGCSAMLLSSPYYPFADRGVTTLQIPLYIAAGKIFFERDRRVTLPGAVLLILVLGFSLPWTFAERWQRSSFSTEVPSMFLDADHRRTLETLKEAASEHDVLLAEYFDYRWLVPEYPGRGFHPHFFLTVDFERRRQQADEFFMELGAGERATFLADEGIDFVWVDRDDYDPDEIAGTPGLVELDRGSHGVLFRFDPEEGPRSASSAQRSSEPEVSP